MCGIWAVINRLNLTTEQYGCFERLMHRGPHGSTLQLYPFHVIGHHFLSIGPSISNSQQPYYHHDQKFNYAIMCNGEIYNHLSIRDKYKLKTQSDSDCSIVFPLFLALKEDFETLNRQLIGQYAIFISKQEVKTGVIEYYLSVDAFSVIPAFYFSNETQFGCASLLAGLAVFSQDVRRLDQGSFIHGRFTPSENNNEILQQRKYTKIPKIRYIHENLQLYQKIVDNFKAAVESRLFYNRPIGCLLSGGIDSSLIASVASHYLKQKGRKLQTFSIGMKDSQDLDYARKVAQFIDSEHTQFVISPVEGLQYISEVIEATESYDPATIQRATLQYLFAKKIAQETKIKVVLTGDGADQSQMGYLHNYLAPNSLEAKKQRDNRTLQSKFELLILIPEVSPDLLIPSNARMEKYLLRRAFSAVWPQILPSEILERKMLSLVEGISSRQQSWALFVKKQVEQTLFPALTGQASPILSVQQKFTFDGIQPQSAQSQYYRIVHSKLFNNNHKILDHYWEALEQT